jgi:hypothetical protein
MSLISPTAFQVTIYLDFSCLSFHHTRWLQWRHKFRYHPSHGLESHLAVPSPGSNGSSDLMSLDGLSKSQRTDTYKHRKHASTDQSWSFRMERIYRQEWTKWIHRYSCILHVVYTPLMILNDSIYCTKRTMKCRKADNRERGNKSGIVIFSRYHSEYRHWLRRIHLDGGYWCHTWRL